MTDIVERLRRDSKWTEGLTDQQIEEMCSEAADEIEMLRRVEHEAAEWVEERTKRLRADNERLRSAQAELRAALCLIERKASQFSGTHWVAVEEIARAALENK